MKTNRRTFLQNSTLLSFGVLAGRKNPQSKDRSVQDDIFQIIKNRRSVRKFKPTPVPKEHLAQILKAANYAPTPRNRQAWKFVITQDKNNINGIKEECIKRSGENSRQYFTDYLSAPVYVVVLAYTKTRNPVNDITAGALAAENLLLAARALGYGTVYAVNSIPADIINKAINTPEDYQFICITPIGIPVEWPRTPNKKDLNEVVVQEKFDA